MILRARQVVTMNGPPVHDGAVVVAGDRITDVGAWPEVRARQTGEVIDLGESILLPGLINAHCHLDYTDLRGAIPRGRSFPEWIQAINQLKAGWREEDFLRSIERGCEEAARFGTTTIANLVAFPALVSRLPELPMRLWWFAEMIDLREPVAPEAVLAKLRAAASSQQRIPGGVGLSPHASYTASLELYRATARIAARESLPSMTHLAESHEEMEMFREGRGEMFDFLRALGRPMADCGAATPAAWLLRSGSLDPRWIVTHLNELDESDFALLASAPKFHIAHCPRSHAYFGHAPFAFERLRGLGFEFCLGTDSLASNEDLNLFAEMRELRRTYPALGGQEILATVTTNAARALQQGEAIGRIAPGYRADLIALPSAGRAADAFERVLEFGGEVPWRMLNGTTALAR